MAISSSSSSTQIVPGMKDIYNQLLGLNQQNYSQVLGAYGAGQANLASQLGGIYGGFGALKDQVMDTLGFKGGWGVAEPARQAIEATYAQTRGMTDQQMISAGLGNTTVRGNLQNQNAYLAGRSYGELGAAMAQQAAQYQSQLGLAEQQARMQGLGLQTDLYGQQGRTLAGYQFGNTAGNLLGNFSNSFSSSGGGGYGGGGGSSSLGGSSMLGRNIANDPNYRVGTNSYGGSSAGGGFGYSPGVQTGPTTGGRVNYGETIYPAAQVAGAVGNIGGMFGSLGGIGGTLGALGNLYGAY